MWRIRAARTAHVASAKDRIQRRLKGKTEGIKMEYVKCKEREIVTVGKGEGNRLFARRTRRMRSKKEQPIVQRVTLWLDGERCAY